MKNYKTSLIASVITSLALLAGCAGTKQAPYKILTEPQVYEETLRLYSFDNKKLPEELKKVFDTRMAQGYRETFGQFLENVDRADGIDDGRLTEAGLTRFLSDEAFDEMSR